MSGYRLQKNAAPIFLRPATLAAQLDVSVATIYRWERIGHLPLRRKMGPSASGWLASEIQEWAENLPLGTSVSAKGAKP